MPQLTIIANMSKTMARLPRYVWVDGVMVGVMRTPSATLLLPPGRHKVRVQSVVRILRADVEVDLKAQQPAVLRFASRESVWDVLFAIDLVLCLARLFFTFPQPYDTIYEVCTNGFFAVWLVYEYAIRNKYYRLAVE